MGKKLTIFMIYGTEYGPKIGEIGNWVGKAVYFPRTAAVDSNLFSRAEFNKPGIYCLKGDATDNNAFDEKIYIGEAENIKARLEQHFKNKEFNEVIFFISKDDLLTKTQVKYLESRLIQMAIEAKSSQIENKNSSNAPTLHESDISDMEYFLSEIKLILPVFGFKFLIPTTRNSELKSETSNSDGKKYFIKTKSFTATMTENERGYFVLKNSQAKKDLSNSITETYSKLRRKLIETSVLIEHEDKLVFSEDAFFNSPSAAASIVLGRNSNGYAEWINEDGKTFKEVQEQLKI